MGGTDKIDAWDIVGTRRPWHGAQNEKTLTGALSRVKLGKPYSILFRAVWLGDVGLVGAPYVGLLAPISWHLSIIEGFFFLLLFCELMEFLFLTLSNGRY